jgi:putative hydrolase of the HAD superfamily
MVEDWGLAMSPEMYAEEFRSWPVGPIAGAEDLVSEVRNRVPVSCFSNTNASHWQRAQALPLISLFDATYLSFQMGMLKPDRDAFEHVADSLGVARERVLFLDDNQLNVDAALEVGFTAIRVSGVGEARRALVENRVIDPGPSPAAGRATAF